MEKLVIATIHKFFWKNMLSQRFMRIFEFYLEAADCVDRIEQRMQGVGWLCGTHCWTCLGLDCHEFRMRLQLHVLCAIHTAITFPPLVSCTATLTVVAPRAAGNAGATVWIATSFRPRPCVFVHTLACRCN